MELRQKAISGVKWVTVSTLVNNLLQLLLISILARLLSPSDFGLMALVNVVVEFSSYFIDAGFSNIIIYKQDINRTQLSSIYWLSIISGMVIYLIIFFLSPYLSEFYKQGELENLLKLVAITFLIIPFGQQYKSLLQKELRFNDIAIIEIIARIISFVVSVIAAIKGFGVYALALMVLSNSSVSTILFFIKGIRNYRPNLVFSHNEIRKFYSFGLYQLGERTVNYFASQFDIIIIGKLFGTGPLGIYTIAKNLVMKPAQIINPIITKVAFPTMAKVQNDNDLLKKIYLNTIRYLSSVNFPIHIGMFILAEPITNILFGNQWSSAIILIRILAIYAMIRSVFNPIGSLLLARGRADLGFFWNIYSSVFLVIILFFGSFGKLIGISLAQLCAMLLLSFPFFKYLIRRVISPTFWEYHSNIILPLILSLLSSLVPLGLVLIIKNNYLQIILVIISGLLNYFFLTLKFNKTFIELIKSFR